MTWRGTCYAIWAVGTCLIVLSWVDVVPPQVGWFGFSLSATAALPTYLPQRQDPSKLPLTREGLPVEHAGHPIPADVRLEVGMPVLAYSYGKWWRATVVAVQEEDEAVVSFLGWDVSHTTPVACRGPAVGPRAPAEQARRRGGRRGSSAAIRCGRGDSAGVAEIQGDAIQGRASSRRQ